VTQMSEASRKIDDVRISALRELITPLSLMDRTPLNEEFAERIFQTRSAIQRILAGDDPRLLIVVGPCSIHDPSAAIDYAGKLAGLSKIFAEKLLVVMRVYFEKPRTTVGWKGLINDPFLDNSFQINDGLEIARKLLLDIHREGLTAATEYLDMITPQFIGDLVSWAAIGARTTESQVHRELASGLSCPVGFKNGTDGNIQIAVDAVRTAAHSHSFLSVTKTGHTAIVETKGNPDCHIILRGGKTTNYDVASVAQACDSLSSSGLAPRVMVDCSHANSSKDFRKQRLVAEDVAKQRKAGANGILGLMIESNIVEGRQDYSAARKMTYGQSITDGCIGFEETERVLEILAN